MRRKINTRTQIAEAVREVYFQSGADLREMQDTDINLAGKPTELVFDELGHPLRVINPEGYTDLMIGNGTTDYDRARGETKTALARRFKITEIKRVSFTGDVYSLWELKPKRFKLF